MHKPHLGIVHLDRIDRSFFNDFESEVGHSELELKIDGRPELGPFASVEWFIPTAIVAFIGKAYFEEFLKEMGKDHYKSLKSSLTKLTKKSISQSRLEPVLMGTPGKIRQDNPYSMAYSIMAEGKDGYNFKLLIQKYSPDINYESIVIKFMEFIADYHLTGDDSSAALEICKSGSPRGTVLVHLNTETGQIEWRDHVPPEVRARVAAQQESSANS